MNMPPDATVMLASHTVRFTTPSMTKKIWTDEFFSAGRVTRETHMY
jgi:hypothetical protein